MTAKALYELEMVLSDEKGAILAANYEALPGIAQVKADLLAQIDGSRLPPAKLRGVKARIDANQALLQAAMNGVQAAQGRLAALKEVRDGLGVYDQSGTRDVVRTVRSTLEKKA
ncbi:MAG: flagellar protein FlgN [Pseudomonadota bacterium]